MDKKNREKVVAGIAIRRNIGKREKEILLVREGDRWTLPMTQYKRGQDGQKCLRDYISEISGANNVRVGRFYNHLNGEGSIESYIVKMKEPLEKEREGIRWFSSREEIGYRGEYPVNEGTYRTIEHLRKEGYF